MTGKISLLDFLDRDTFFDNPYNGNSGAYKIIYDVAQAIEYSTNDSGVAFQDWQSLLESITPAWPDMPRKIEREIISILDEMTNKSILAFPMAL